MQKSSSKRNWGRLKLNLGALFFASLVFFGIYKYWDLSPSYKASREAKVYYDAGDYEKALELALVVQKDNSYNIMAYTIVEQSQKAIKWQKFIKQASEYEARTKEILSSDRISSADLSTIKFMCEAVIYDYAKLGDAGILMDDKISDEAKRLDKEFRAVYQNILAIKNP